MFDRLQKKWNVSATQLFLVLTTFAIGGSLTGYAGRKLMSFLPISQNWLWIVVYIILITLLWPISVLLVSILFGQYRFFKTYLAKIGRRMGITSGNKIELSQYQYSDPVRIAIFASGTGSNAQKIIDHFRENKRVVITLICCNKAGAGVLDIAVKANIPAILIDKEKFFKGNAYLDELKEYGIDLLVLAGFLWKVPEKLIEAFPLAIVNIHPALLPKFGGKGMYGGKVHEAVINNKEEISGITIHFVDNHYDHGDVIFQATCPVLPTDTPEILAQRIHQLEHMHYPRVIEDLAARIRKKKRDS